MEIFFNILLYVLATLEICFGCFMVYITIKAILGILRGFYGGLSLIIGGIIAIIFLSWWAFLGGIIGLIFFGIFLGKATF